MHSANIYFLTMKNKAKYGGAGYGVCFLEVPLLLMPATKCLPLNHIFTLTV